MEFFNKKEDVIDIQLTSYGKKKLSMGKFKPVYYAFYDDDIVYDTNYGGWDEDQNKNENRILSAPTLRPSTSNNGISANLDKTPEEQADGDKNKFLTMPLGNGETGGNNLARWSLRFFNENLTHVDIKPTGSFYAIGQIPQLYATVEYRTFIDKIEKSEIVNVSVDQADFDLGVDGNTVGENHIFPDDTFINLESDSLFLRVEELATEFERDNFEVEIYEVDTYTDNAGNTKETLNQLYFYNEESDFIDFNDLKSTQYYFEINIDREIDSNEFCQKVPRNERSLYYVDRIYDCLDVETDERFRKNIYDKSESGKICK